MNSDPEMKTWPCRTSFFQFEIHCIYTLTSKRVITRLIERIRIFANWDPKVPRVSRKLKAANSDFNCSVRLRKQWIKKFFFFKSICLWFHRKAKI